MFYYLKNITSDIIFGYVDVKCANKNCNKIHKFSRNNIDFNTNNYCCNMSCAFESYNQDQKELDNKFNVELRNELQNELQNELYNGL